VTLTEFFKQFRSEVDDLRTPYLWSDDDIESYLNWALEELAIKSRFFLDRSTWEGLTITADDPKITATSSNKLDRILLIIRATLGSTDAKLNVRSMAQSDTVPHEDDYGRYLYDISSAWETESGTPRLVVTDYYEDGSLRIGPIPGAADTLNLWAYRLPLYEVSLSQSGSLDLSELIGIKENTHQHALLTGMKSRAYLKEDPETRDTQLAEEAGTRFYNQLAEIKNQLHRRRRPVGKIRYGGI
jgi:hypothetical protein